MKHKMKIKIKDLVVFLMHLRIFPYLLNGIKIILELNFLIIILQQFFY